MTTSESIAMVIRRTTITAWNLSIGGSSWPQKDAIYNRMKQPQVGDFVVEMTTLAGWRGGKPNDIDAVGVLLEIVDEPMREGRSGDPVSEDQPFIEWNEESDGPRPIERVFYIRTLDGRRFRWANASLLAVPIWLQS